MELNVQPHSGYPSQVGCKKGQKERPNLEAIVIGAQSVR